MSQLATVNHIPTVLSIITQLHYFTQQGNFTCDTQLLYILVIIFVSDKQIQIIMTLLAVLHTTCSLVKSILSNSLLHSS